ncbi:hypothetical protein DPMN_155620 [Dreissena polymorpha]|uniref:Uncharacterized protein n=1 Tax=Dreissena polymorpha TaxID=45954 RepID=A0A9D4FNA3_DREPO|nr:hypothetical protein DPMN_155620 [Dreissena polymorpha]
MEVSTEKSKNIVNSLNYARTVITINDEKLVKVTSFHYLGATCVLSVGVNK